MFSLAPQGTLESEIQCLHGCHLLGLVVAVCAHVASSSSGHRGNSASLQQQLGRWSTACGEQNKGKTRFSARKEAPDRLRDKVWQMLLHEPHIWSQGFTGYSINNYNHYLMAQDGPGHGFYTRLPSYLHLTTTDTEAPSSRRPPLTASRSLSILSSPFQRPACVCPCVFILVSNDL